MEKALIITALLVLFALGNLIAFGYYYSVWYTYVSRNWGAADDCRIVNQN